MPLQNCFLRHSRFCRALSAPFARPTGFPDRGRRDAAGPPARPRQENVQLAGERCRTPQRHSRLSAARKSEPKNRYEYFKRSRAGCSRDHRLRANYSRAPHRNSRASDGSTCTARLLPKYRGAAPIHWAIVNGETRTGLTTMQIDAGLDTGPMLLKYETDIGPDETAPELYARLIRSGRAADGGNSAWTRNAARSRQLRRIIRKQLWRRR